MHERFKKLRPDGEDLIRAEVQLAHGGTVGQALRQRDKLVRPQVQLRKARAVADLRRQHHQRIVSEVPERRGGGELVS